MTALSKQCHEMNKKQADIITEEQVNIMRKKGLLSIYYPQLLDTMLYQIELNFALCTGQEHKICAWDQSQIKDRLTRMDNHLVIVVKIYCPIS